MSGGRVGKSQSRPGSRCWGDAWEALGPSELSLQVPTVCWAWLRWETGPLSGHCSRRLPPVGPAVARAHGQTFVNSLALWRFWGRGLSRGDQVGGAKIRSGLPSQREASAQVTSCWKLDTWAGTGGVCGHVLPVPSLSGQAPDVLVALAVGLEGGQAAGWKDSCSGAGGPGFPSVAEGLRANDFFPVSRSLRIKCREQCLPGKGVVRSKLVRLEGPVTGQTPEQT